MVKNTSDYYLIYLYWKEDDKLIFISYLSKQKKILFQL